MAIEFKIDRLVWVDRRTVEAKGGHRESGLSSSTVTYLLRRTKSGWTVVLDRLNTIS